MMRRDRREYRAYDDLPWVRVVRHEERAPKWHMAFAGRGVAQPPVFLWLAWGDLLAGRWKIAWRRFTYWPRKTRGLHFSGFRNVRQIVEAQREAERKQG